MLTVILTGGGSRRMGRDKAMLPWGEGTLLQHLIDKYSALGDVAVSVNEAGRFAFNGAHELVDRYPDCGPLNGIVSAFEETKTDIIFMTATDLPFGSTELVEKLCNMLEQYDACVMQRGVKELEPLFAIYGRRCYDAAKQCLSQGKKSFFQMLKMMNVRYVSEDELKNFDLDAILMNVNTPEEYLQAEKQKSE